VLLTPVQERAVEAEVEGMAVVAEHRMPWAAAAISAVAERLEPLVAAELRMSRSVAGILAGVRVSAVPFAVAAACTSAERLV